MIGFIEDNVLLIGEAIAASIMTPFVFGFVFVQIGKYAELLLTGLIGG